MEKEILRKYSIKVFGGLLVILIFILSMNYYLIIKSSYSYGAFELELSRMVVLINFNLIFFLLYFILKLEIYKYLFIYLALYGIFLWVLQYLSFTIGEKDLSFTLDIYFSIMLFMTYNIIAPGLILYIINYIQKISSKIEGNIKGTYHIHESFFGSLLIGIGIILFTIRLYLIQYNIYWNELKIILAIFNVATFVFLFFGSFFFFRDIRDVLKLKFIEKVKSEGNSEGKSLKTSVFLNIKESSISFYKKFKVPLYPLGIFFTNFAFNMVIYGSDFLLVDIFHLKYNDVVVLGYLFVFFTAGILGLDWVNIFKRFYPKKYQELKKIISELRKS